MTQQTPRCGARSNSEPQRVCDLRLGHPGEHRQLAPNGDWVWSSPGNFAVPDESDKPETEASPDTKAIVRELRRIRKELVLIRQKLGELDP